MPCDLVVALDFIDIVDAGRLAVTLGDTVSIYKIGMRLLLAPELPAFMTMLHAMRKRVFLDYKLYDIPQTVQASVAAIASLGANYVTVHGDPEIIEAAVAGTHGTDVQVLAVTVLTSQDDTALRRMGYTLSVVELVHLRAQAALDAGAHGVIAAVENVGMIRQMATRPFTIMTPGIRLPNAVIDDQKRVGTPQEAAQAGADFVVVGRPITQALTPRANALAIQAMLRLPAPMP